MNRQELVVVIIVFSAVMTLMGVDTRPRSVLTPERRAQILAAYEANVDAGASQFDGLSAVRQEDFEIPVTRKPCPPLTWMELIALIERDEGR